MDKNYHPVKGIIAIIVFVLIWTVVLIAPSARAQVEEPGAAMTRTGDSTLNNGELVGAAGQLDGGSVVVSLSEWENVWYLVITQIQNGMNEDRLSLPWGKPSRVIMVTSGTNLSVVMQWENEHISAYSWAFSSPFSKEYQVFVPMVKDD